MHRRHCLTAMLLCSSVVGASCGASRPAARGACSVTDSADSVVLFADEAFGGASLALRPGVYPNLEMLGFPVDAASSIRVGCDVVAVVHSCPDFGGGFVNGFRAYESDDASFADDVWPQGQACETDTVDDAVDALWVMRRRCVPGANEVAFFDRPDFEGGCVVVPVGLYDDPGTAGVPNDFVGSIKVGAAVELTVWSDANQGGTENVLAAGELAAVVPFGDDTVSSFSITLPEAR